MGLDWLVRSKAKPGHEAEHARLFEELFVAPRKGRTVAWKRLSEQRLDAISIDQYETLGAPRVGYDEAATAHAVKTRETLAPLEDEQKYLRRVHGMPVPHLLPPCAGLPRYSNAGFTHNYPTAFRGDFLKETEDVIGTEKLERAWGPKTPEELVRYGRALLRLAERAALDGGRDLKALTDLEVEGSLDRRLDIVVAAGEWCVFWGERGHGMDPWF